MHRQAPEGAPMLHHYLPSSTRRTVHATRFNLVADRAALTTVPQQIVPFNDPHSARTNEWIRRQRPRSARAVQPQPRAHSERTGCLTPRPPLSQHEGKNSPRFGARHPCFDKDGNRLKLFPRHLGEGVLLPPTFYQYTPQTTTTHVSLKSTYAADLIGAAAEASANVAAIMRTAANGPALRPTSAQHRIAPVLVEPASPARPQSARPTIGAMMGMESTVVRGSSPRVRLAQQYDAPQYDAPQYDAPQYDAPQQHDALINDVWAAQEMVWATLDTEAPDVAKAAGRRGCSFSDATIGAAADAGVSAPVTCCGGGIEEVDGEDSCSYIGADARAPDGSGPPVSAAEIVALLRRSLLLALESDASLEALVAAAKVCREPRY